MIEIKLLDQVNLYKIIEIGKNITAESLLGSKVEKLSLEKNKDAHSTVVGDIILVVKNTKKANLKANKVVFYPVQKIKGRFSDLKEYIYLKMKVLYDFNLYYLGKKEIEAVEKDSAHIKFEDLIDNNQEKIKALITYNSDENVKPFNHTNYEVKTILDSKKIFSQEIGEKFDWGWSLMEIYQINEKEFVSYKQSSYFRERQRGEFFKISKKAVDFMREFDDDKNDFL